MQRIEHMKLRQQKRATAKPKKKDDQVDREWCGSYFIDVFLPLCVLQHHTGKEETVAEKTERLKAQIASYSTLEKKTKIDFGLAKDDKDKE